MNASPTLISSENAPWRAMAGQLSGWAMERLVNRTDVWGAYLPLHLRGPDGEDKSRTAPAREADRTDECLTRDRLALHFQGRVVTAVIGLHAISQDNTCRWVGWDFDVHSASDDAAANLRAVVFYFDKLTSLGFSPLLNTSDEKGGYHLRVLFNAPCSSVTAYHFGRWLVADYADHGLKKSPEWFPKQECLTEKKKYGNWMRVPGRHHTRDVWTRVFDGIGWREGTDAVNTILNMTGDDPAMIPVEAATLPPRAKSTVRRSAGTSSGSAEARLRKCRKYIDKLPPSKSGEHGHDRLFHAACVTLRFGLSGSDAMGLLRDYNQVADPPWPDEELARKIEQARPEVGDAFGTWGNGDEADATDRDAPIMSALQRAAAERRPRAPVTIERAVPTSGDATADTDPAAPDDAPDFDDVGINESEAGESVGKSAETTPPGESGGEEPFVPHPDDVVEHPEPLRLAEHLLHRRFTDAVGRRRLRRYRGQWWHYGHCGYAQMDDEFMASRVYQHLDGVWTPDRDKAGESTGEFKKVVPNSARVAEVMKAVPSCGAFVTGVMPQWLDARREPNPADLVAFRNGLLDTADYRVNGPSLIPPTPEWFSGTACPYDFDPRAGCPLWIETMKRFFDGDGERIDLLQEWFGLQLVPDNRYEKLMLLRGLPRSGKGTTLTMMTHMLGREQVAITSFTKLSGRFGMHPLLGKLAALMPDAHISKHVDAKGALEALKTITGGDDVSVDRKGIDELPDVALNVRFTIGVNELPELPDDAGALKPRLLLLHYPLTFAGREDTTLKARLPAERAGVANWALEGLCRLREQGAFTVPESSRASVEAFERILAPVLGFVDEACELEPSTWIAKDDLYKAWVKWSEDRGEAPGTKAMFGQKLVNAVPVIDGTGRRGPRGQQFSVYAGIRLMSTICP